jgi:tryptophan synthase alpha chain
MTGIEKIEAAFQMARSQDRGALILYHSLGYPTQADSLAVVRAAAKAGADIIELGVPFSDPLADGPTIQHSTQVALEQGTTVQRCLAMTSELRAGGITLPLLLMGYINPILAYGLKRFTADALKAGADGIIVPDLPPEEAGDLEEACRECGLALVYLLSPASPPARAELVAARTTGFLYLVSLTGVTGARDSLPSDLPEFVARTRGYAHTPVAVGFGISTPAQAAEVGKLADGVIIGSALINAVRTAVSQGLPVDGAAFEFVASLKKGMFRSPA